MNKLCFNNNAVLLFLFFVCASSSSIFRLAFGAYNNNVTYDARSLIIDGQRKLLISASIHYPRSVPEMWPGLIEAAKEGGANAIETYVFWNGHELSPGNYNFGGRFDLVKFVKIVQRAGMYLVLRIGPHVGAEWNFGGVPVWLHFIPGTIFRTYNEPYMNFTTYIVNLMKQENLFASQGGPIILSQIENEYGLYEQAYLEGGKNYTMWAANMAVSQNTGVPWIMCTQSDAPDPVINTCNSFYCHRFRPNSPNKPKIWTENWTGWFTSYGSRKVQRPPEDLAYAVARFFQKGGTVQIYYMRVKRVRIKGLQMFTYHGGTNFGRTSGPFGTTSYDYDGPIDEYGLPRNPKWGHLKELHRAIKLCEHVLLYGKSEKISLGPYVEADVFSDSSSGACGAFIANNDSKNDTTVEFRNSSYDMPAWSVSILPDCKNVVFNTAKVSSQTNIVAMVPENLQQSGDDKALKWDVFKENAGIWGQPDFVQNDFIDHINATKDTTDYLWQTTSVFVAENETFLSNGSNPVLTVESKGHLVYVFINQQYQGIGIGVPLTYTNPIPLKAGENEIALLSIVIGLPSAGPFYDFVGAGITNVTISGFNNGTLYLTNSSTWNYKIGVQGENLKIYQEDGLNSVNWTSTSEPPKGQQLTWYKAIVDAPPGDEPVALDMSQMGKGQAWLNGEGIGRYWPMISGGKCVKKECNYKGPFSRQKCVSGCGEPTQKWYHVPRSWFKPYGNVLVIFEETGGDPTQITFQRRKVSGVCALVAEDYPSVAGLDHKNTTFAHLTCPNNTVISAVNFASFGNPSGNCGSYLKGDCHDTKSREVVEKACLNKNKCAIKLTEENFKTNLCHGLSRKLAVEVACS